MNEEIEKKIIVTPTSKLNCQSFPLVEGKTIKLTEEELSEIGKTKCFDLENLTLIDYDPEKDEELIEQKNQAEIAKLKKYLAETDYCVIKIAEGEATQEEYAEVLAKRKQARARINELL